MPPAKENTGSSAAVSALMALAGSPPATPKAEDANMNMDEVDLRGKSAEDVNGITNKSNMMMNSNNENHHPKTQAALTMSTTRIPIIDEAMAEHSAHTLDTSSHGTKSAKEIAVQRPASGGKKASSSASDEATSTSNITRFPNKLMAVLDSTSYSDVVSWSPDGASFVFHDSDAFERVVLPNIFKVAKFDSFLRKLYRWGFSKCQAYSRVGCPAYKHEKFLQDQPEMLSEMECRSKPKTQYTAAVPLTLNSYQAQSAPQLRRNSNDPTEGSGGRSGFSTTPPVAVTFEGIPNAAWEQGVNQLGIPQQGGQSMSPLSTGMLGERAENNGIQMRADNGIQMPSLTGSNNSQGQQQQNHPSSFSPFLNLNNSAQGQGTDNATAAANILKSKLAMAASIEEQNRLLSAARASVLSNSATSSGLNSGNLGNLGPYRNPTQNDSTNSLASTASTTSKKRPGSNMDLLSRQSSSHRSLSNFSVKSRRSQTTPSNLKFLNNGSQHNAEHNSTFQLGGHQPTNAMDNARKMLNQLNLATAANATASNRGQVQQQQNAELMAALSTLQQQQHQQQQQSKNHILNQQQQAQILLEQQRKAIASLIAARSPNGLPQQQQQHQSQQQGGDMSMASGTPSLGAAQAAKLLMEQQNAIAMLNAAQRGGDQNMALPQSSLSTVMEQQEQANILSALNAARLAEGAGAGGNGVQQQRPGDASSASNSSPALSAQQNALAAFRAAQASNQSGGDSGGLSTNGSAPQNVASSNGNNGSNQLPALKILQLLEEHDRLEQQVKNQLALQNHIDRLRLENELKRQLLQNEVSNHDGQNRNSGQMMQQHMQTDMNIDQARILQEEVQRRARLQSEVQRALLNNMNAPNNSGHPSNSGNQNQFMPP